MANSHFAARARNLLLDRAIGRLLPAALLVFFAALHTEALADAPPFTLPLPAGANHAVCGPNGNDVWTCTPEPTTSCPAWWTNTQYAYTYWITTIPDNYWASNLGDACSLAATPLSLYLKNQITTQSVASGCQITQTDPYTGQIDQSVQSGFGICYPSSPPPPPFPPLNCAYGSGGFQRCITNPSPPPDSPPPPGTPIGGGQNPNAGPPGTDASPPTTDRPEAIEAPTDPLEATCAATSAGSSDASGVGDPIFAGSGSIFYQVTDYKGPRGMNLTRAYNSSVPGWNHNWNIKIIANNTTAIAIRPDGRAHRFTGTGPGIWTPEPGTREQLVQLVPSDPSQAAWQYLSAEDVQEYYDGQGNLLSLTLRGGMTYTAVRSAGVLTEIVDPFGHRLHFSYDSASALVAITTPEGSTISYQSDSKGRLAAVGYPDGSSNQYLYENGSYPLALTAVVDGRGIRIATWTYDSSGRAVSFAGGGGVGGYQLSYGADGSATVTDPLGTTRTQSYSVAGRRKLFAGQTGPCANCTGDASSKTFDEDGLLAQSVDYLGIATLFTNDAQRKLPLSTTRAAGLPEQQQTTIQWHPNFHLPVLVSEPGRSTSFNYDPAGNLLTRTVTDAATGAARTWAWAYTPQGLPSAMTDPAGGNWSYAYDAQGNMVGFTDPVGRQTQFAYDAGGRVLSRTDPGGLVTTYAYDARGRLIQRTRDTETTQYSYTAAGQLQAIYMPAQFAYFFAYDSAQRLVAITDSRGPVVRYTLDNMGNRVRETLTDSLGNIAGDTTRVFDALGRLVTVSSAEGRSTTFGYNANSALTGSQRFSESVAMQLDGIGRPVTISTADGATTRQAWNGLDALTQVVDPNNVATVYTMNAFGEVMSESGPDAGATSYARDAAGRVVGWTDARGVAATISRDALGRPQQVTAANQSQAFTYDVGGFISNIVDKSGSTTYTRDLQGRVLRKLESVNDDPSAPRQLPVGYGYQLGYLSDISYPSGLKVHYLRQFGLVTSIQVQLPGGTAKKPKPFLPFINSIAYSPRMQPQSWTWNSGDSASRWFDGEGLMVHNEFADYGYDPGGRVIAITQNLWYALTSTSPDGAITTQLGTTPLNWGAVYDNRGRVAYFGRDATSSNFSYDANSNRLTSVETTTSDIDLNGEYDAADFSKTDSRTLAVDGSSNRLLGFQYSTSVYNAGKVKTTASSTINYTLDANGSLTSDGLRTFQYDEFGRLSTVRVFNSADGETAIVTYLTNALGQRVFKSEPTPDAVDPTPVTDDFIAWLKKNFGWLYTKAQNTASLGTAYVYGDGEIPDWALLGEYDNAGTSGVGRTEYLWLPTPDGSAIPVGMYRGGRLFAVHPDHLGTPRLMTDDTNKPVWQWPYSAFGTTKPSGVLAATPNPKAATTNQPVLLKATAPTLLNLRYPGQYFDSEVGTFYNMQRDEYDQRMGRYRQADPIGLAGGINRFIYSGNDPLGFSDPLGLDRWGDAPAQSWYCTAPLHAAPSLDFGGVGPFHHGFVCTSDGVCGGQDRSGNPLFSKGKPSEGDQFNPQRCESAGESSRCVANCINREINGPRPFYSIVPRAGARVFSSLAPMCQEWAQQKILACMLECKGG